MWMVAGDDQMRNLLGPSLREQWMYWKTQTDVQRQRRATVSELSKILQSNQVGEPLIVIPKNQRVSYC